MSMRDLCSEVSICCSRSIICCADLRLLVVADKTLHVAFVDGDKECRAVVMFSESGCERPCVIWALGFVRMEVRCPVSAAGRPVRAC